MTGSKGTRAGIRVTSPATASRRRVTCLITLNYPRLRCLHCLRCLRLLVGPLLLPFFTFVV